MLLLTLALLLADAKPAAYAKPDLLVEPGTLRSEAFRKKVTILDARPRAAYDKGHVSDAVWVDPAGWSKAFGTGADREGWEKRIGKLGMTTKSTVVVYDDAQAKDSARIWWILRYWGVADVRLVNGGWSAYVAANGPTSKDEPAVKVTTPTLKASSTRHATKADLLDSLKSGKFGQLIDTRSEGEHCGDTKLAKRGGTIPKSKHLEWSQTQDKKTGRFKSADELKKLFADAGIDPAKPAVTYCQSGGRAAVMAFVLELMSGKEARNYYRSWAEWGNDDETPIEKPSKK